MADAGERSEKPTPKKLKDAREKGQVARSRDLSGALSFAAVTLGFSWFGLRMVTTLADRIAEGLTRLGDHARVPIDGSGLAGQLWADAGLISTVVGPVVLVAGVVSIAGSVSQVGWLYSPKAAEFNWSRLSPSQGFARFKPSQAGAELVKSVIGMAAIALVLYSFVRQMLVEAPLMMAMTPAAAASFGWGRAWSLLWRASLTLVVLAAGDYALQRWRWLQGVKMSRQEIRDEARQQDGNPEIKQRVKKVQREMTRRRMLQAVKTATVVVTNPTHFAVALEYRRNEMAAPIVVAKGQDLMAARIRKVAQQHGVPIVENVTLARALYKTAEIGDTIPAALFGAVAEVLAYLVRIKQLMF